MEFLQSFLKPHLAWQPVVVSQNVGCFLKSSSEYNYTFCCCFQIHVYLIFCVLTVITSILMFWLVMPIIVNDNREVSWNMFFGSFLGLVAITFVVSMKGSFVAFKASFFQYNCCNKVPQLQVSESLQEQREIVSQGSHYIFVTFETPAVANKDPPITSQKIYSITFGFQLWSPIASSELNSVSDLTTLNDSSVNPIFDLNFCYRVVGFQLILLTEKLMVSETFHLVSKFWNHFWWVPKSWFCKFPWVSDFVNLFTAKTH